MSIVIDVSTKRQGEKKGDAFSIRLSATTDKFVEAEARRRKRSKSAIVEALTEEAARMQRFPGIAFRGEDYKRRAYLVGTGLDVSDVIRILRSYGEAATEVRDDYPNLTAHAIRLAEVYEREFPDELEAEIVSNEASDDEIRALYPLVELVEVP